MKTKVDLLECPLCGEECEPIEIEAVEEWRGHIDTPKTHWFWRLLKSRAAVTLIDNACIVSVVALFLWLYFQIISLANMTP